MLNGDLLITGGSGTIGKAIIKRATAENWPGRISIFSRSELLQAQIKAEYKEVNGILGDIRDYDRLSAAIAGHDYVIHAAAMKRIPESENQPGELARTNVQGSLNVIRACKVNRVKRAVFLSTDKAAAPITAYGASKLMMERAICAQMATPTIFTAVRYGNVISSRGSVIPIWRKQAERAERLTVTDPEMTRFWISPALAVDYILTAFTHSPGSVYVPKMKSLSIVEMARYICPGSQHKYIGLRSAERIHEYLIMPEESGRETAGGFIIDEMGHPGHEWRSDTAPKWDKEGFLSLLGGE